tara:strand:- start:302 stop:445 length:144 start_codon:yes stop_codon:yes gene_type:complete
MVDLADIRFLASRAAGYLEMDNFVYVLVYLSCPVAFNDLQTIQIQLH